MKWKSSDVGEAPKQGFCAYKIGSVDVCLLFLYL